jgi:hypothetical protein
MRLAPAPFLGDGTKEASSESNAGGSGQFELKPEDRQMNAWDLRPWRPRIALSGTGLIAQYFHNSDFTGLAENSPKRRLVSSYELCRYDRSKYPGVNWFG